MYSSSTSLLHSPLLTTADTLGCWILCSWFGQLAGVLLEFYFAERVANYLIYLVGWKYLRTIWYCKNICSLCWLPSYLITIMLHFCHFSHVWLLSLSWWTKRDFNGLWCKNNHWITTAIGALFESQTVSMHLFVTVNLGIVTVWKIIVTGNHDIVTVNFSIVTVNLGIVIMNCVKIIVTDRPALALTLRETRPTEWIVRTETARQ